MLTVECTCGKKLTVKDEHAGKLVRCPGCQATVRVPMAESPSVLPETEESISEKPTPPAIPAIPKQQEDNYSERLSGEYHEDDYDRPRRKRRRAMEVPTSTAAVTSMVFGILAFCLPGIGTLVGVICGIVALSAIASGAVKGKGYAITGIILSGVGLLIWLCVPILIGLLLPAVQSVRSAAGRMQTTNNLKIIGLAMHNYNDSYGKFPNHAIYSKDGRPLLSWRVAILPYIEQDNLYRQFRLDEPWDSPNNIRLLSQMPKDYQHPAAETDNAMGKTHFQVFVGQQNTPRQNPLFVRDSNWRATLPGIIDGSSNTFMVVESANAIEWTKPDDLSFVPNAPLPPLGGFFGDNFITVFADGSVRTIRNDTDPMELQRAITIDDGNRPNLD